MAYGDNMLKSDIYLNRSTSRTEKDTLEDVVQRAEKLGISILTFLDSIERENGILRTTYLHGGAARKQELSHLKNLREKVHVLNGFEVAEPYLREEELQLYNTFPLDVIIGSVEKFATTLTEEEQIKKAYDNYYYRNLKSVIMGNIDVLAHLGSIQKYYDYSYNNTGVIDSFLKMLIQKEIVLEIEPNLERKDTLYTYPSFALLKRYRELGGEKVIIASHAQSVDLLAFHLEECYKMAKDLNLVPGYFEKRKFKKLI